MSIKDHDYAVLIAKACEKKVSSKEIAQELWYSLYRDKKLGQIEKIFKMAEDIIDRQNHQLRAIVSSSSPLNPDETAEVKHKLANFYQEEIIIDNIIDPSLGAGIEIKIGHKTFDFSLKGRIQQLAKKLKEKYEI